MSEELVKRLRSGGETCGIDACKVRDAKSGCLCATAADRIEALEATLRVAAGYISTKEGHTDQHPQDVYDWIVRAALAGEKKDER